MDCLRINDLGRDFRVIEGKFFSRFDYRIAGSVYICGILQDDTQVVRLRDYSSCSIVIHMEAFVQDRNGMRGRAAKSFEHVKLTLFSAPSKKCVRHNFPPFEVKLHGKVEIRFHPNHLPQFYSPSSPHYNFQ